MSRGIVVLVFRCSPASGDIHLTAEAHEVRWLTRDEVRTLMSPAFAVRVLDAFDAHTTVRAHDEVNLLTA